MVLVGLGIVGGSFYGYQKYEERSAAKSSVETQTTVDTTAKPAEPKTVTTTKTVNTKTQQDVAGIKVNTDITADVTTTVDCGTESCFEKKFAACEPATLQADAGIGAVAYTIKGATAGGCKMSMKYTAIPNPDWLNKEMTCVYDNKLNFQTSLEKTINGVMAGSVVCEGSLYSAMRSF